MNVQESKKESKDSHKDSPQQICENLNCMLQISTPGENLCENLCIVLVHS